MRLAPLAKTHKSLIKTWNDLCLSDGKRWCDPSVVRRLNFRPALSRLTAFVNSDGKVEPYLGTTMSFSTFFRSSALVLLHDVGPSYTCTETSFLQAATNGRMFGHGHNKRPSVRPIAAGGLEKVIYQGRMAALRQQQSSSGSSGSSAAAHVQIWGVIGKPVQIGSFFVAAALLP